MGMQISLIADTAWIRWEKNQDASFHSGFSNEQAQCNPFVNSPSLMTSLLPASQILPPSSFQILLQGVNTDHVQFYDLSSASGLSHCNISTLRWGPLAGHQEFKSGPSLLRLAPLDQTPAVFLPLRFCAPRMHTWYNYRTPPPVFCPLFHKVSSLVTEFTNNPFYSTNGTWCLSPFPLRLILPFKLISYNNPREQVLVGKNFSPFAPFKQW